MSDIVSESVLYENVDWAVTSAGLEHKGNGYFIEREHLDSRRTDGLWTWPLHMLEKTWCTPHVFAEAFAAALLAYGLAPDASLAASFAAALQPSPVFEVVDLPAMRRMPARGGARPHGGEDQGRHLSQRVRRSGDRFAVDHAAEQNRPFMPRETKRLAAGG